jgi:hypothetical protein
MSSVVISGDTSGAITLSAPAVAGTNTITLPAATGTVMVSGNMPAFSAYSSAGANISSSTWTKITLDTETFDTNSNFASNRFTPTVAGYYQINLMVSCGSSANNAYWQWVSIYKNGSPYASSTPVNGLAQLQSFSWSVNQLVYMNGSTDYIEFYVNIYTSIILMMFFLLSYYLKM